MWVGELTFLNRYLDQDEDIGKPRASGTTPPPGSRHDKIGTGISMYTILADEDCEVLCWSHEVLAELMDSSTDLRAALTRAMTSAMVGKVVNLTVSHADKDSEDKIDSVAPQLKASNYDYFLSIGCQKNS